MRRLVIFVLAIAPCSCLGQGVMQVSGGASSFGGNGGAITLYSNNSEARFGGGILNGRFVYNTSQRFTFRSWDVDLGDSMLFLSGGQLGLSAPVRGLGLGKHYKRSEFHLFAGAIGEVLSSPAGFFGIEHSKIGGGLSFKKEFGGGLTLGTIQAIDVRHKTSLGEFQWKPVCASLRTPPVSGAGASKIVGGCWLKHFEFRGNAGILQDSKQTDGSVNLTVRHFGATASKALYVFQPQAGLSTTPATNGLPRRITVDSAAAFGGVSILTTNVSIFRSALSVGKTFGVGARLGAVQVQGSIFNSTSKTAKQKGLLLTTSERLGLHLSLTEYASRSNGVWSFSGGMNFASNRFSVGVSQSLLYYPALAQRPFQRTFSINFTLRIKSASVSATTIPQMNGRSQWGIGGNDYVSTVLRVPVIPGATGNDIHQLPSSAGHGGKHTFRFLVVDDKGPVEGAALLVGSDLIFTDSQGRASVREKHKTMPIKVDTDNFLAGNFTVVKAPTEATEGEIQIVVKRQ